MVVYVDNSFTLLIVFAILGLMTAFGALLDKRGFFLPAEREEERL